MKERLESLEPEKIEVKGDDDTASVINTINLESLENKIDELKNIRTIDTNENIKILSTYANSVKNDINNIKNETLRVLEKKRIRLLKNVNGLRMVFYQEVIEDGRGNIIKYGDVMVAGGDINRSGAGRNLATFGFYRVGIPKNVEIVDVVGGHGSFFAQEKNSASMWVWGKNAQGCLGVGHSSPVQIPVKVTFNKKIKKIASQSADINYQFAFVLLEDGSLYGAGRNADGELGIGNTIDSAKFLQSLSNVKDVFVGNNWASGVYAITYDGKLYAWGYNVRGWLGLGHSNSVNTPTLVTNVTNAKTIYHSTYTDGSWYGNTFIITTDNKLLGAGYNGQYNLSQTDTNQRNSFVPIVDDRGIPLSNIASFKGGGVYDVALALDRYGYLYSWGCADYGLGDNRTSHSRCKLIATGVKQIEKQGYRYPQNFILYSDGHMGAFGYNEKNNLGVGNTTNPIRSITEVILPSEITDFCVQAKYETESILVATDKNQLFECGNLGEGIINVPSTILQPQILK